ncbi:MAG TPA: CRISPR system precrRNA processing endoribonuclease RAMP protein Cas6, partial [Thermotogota bacterium]|nr:CRISPR system precrRNA processing endoribonuclease RAMP protein Cas6 [Thermotogota bacterium]
GRHSRASKRGGIDVPQVFFQWVKSTRGFEFRVDVRARVKGMLPNSAERLRAEFWKALSAPENHVGFPLPLSGAPFRFSPLFSTAPFALCREFAPHQPLFFRFSCWGDRVASAFRNFLDSRPVLLLGGFPFEGVQLSHRETSSEALCGLPKVLNLEFLTPVAFRSDHNDHLPFPCPEALAHYLARATDNAMLPPPLLRATKGQTCSFRFTSHAAAGFLGSVQIESCHPELYGLLHFLGTGYANDRGMGVTLVHELQPDRSFYALPTSP